MSKPTDLPRKPIRYKVNVKAWVRIVGHLDWIACETENLSEGGVCVTSTLMLEPEDLVEFLFETEDKEKIRHQRRVLAKLVWRKSGKLGFQFVRKTATAS